MGMLRPRNDAKSRMAVSYEESCRGYRWRGRFRAPMLVSPPARRPQAFGSVHAFASVAHFEAQRFLPTLNVPFEARQIHQAGGPGTPARPEEVKTI